MVLYTLALALLPLALAGSMYPQQQQAISMFPQQKQWGSSGYGVQMQGVIEPQNQQMQQMQQMQNNQQGSNPTMYNNNNATMYNIINNATMYNIINNATMYNNNGKASMVLNTE
ncbi:hypothetical protein ACOMHN_047004 [Nucella lapillus]